MPLDLSAIADDAPSATEDKLTVIRKRIAELRYMRFVKADLEERLEEVYSHIKGLETQVLPDLMAEARVKNLGIEAEGNLPAVEVESAPYYAASIPASWPSEQRQAAYDWLTKNGHGDLIRTEVTVAFPREQHTQAHNLAEALIIGGYVPLTKESVHHATLTAWLKEQVERHGRIPPLDILGARIGRVARIKEINK